MDRDLIERALRLARGGYADGGDAEFQSNGMPVFSDGQVNWGDSAADFARADAAMRAMRSEPAPERMAEPSRAPAPYAAPRNVPLPPPRPASLNMPQLADSIPEGPGSYIPGNDFGAPARATPEMLFDPNLMSKDIMAPKLSMGFNAPPSSFGGPSPNAPSFTDAQNITPGAPEWPPAPPRPAEGKFTNRVAPLTPPAAPEPTTEDLLQLLSNPSQPPAVAAIERAATSNAPPFEARDISNLSTYSHRPMDGVPQALIVHHTAGRGTPEGVVDTLNQRGLGTHYVIDRTGQIHQALRSGAAGAHMRPSDVNNLSNANTVGVEVIANDDRDITPQQIEASYRLRDMLRGQNPDLQVYGHGEVNKHKQATEGTTIANVLRGGQRPVFTPSAPSSPTIAGRSLNAYMGRADGGMVEGREGHAGSGFVKPFIKGSKHIPLVTPPAKAPRAFELDYPRGAEANASGRLERSIDNVPLTAPYIAGRQTPGGPDVPLSKQDMEAIMAHITGRPVEYGPLKGGLADAVTVSKGSGRPTGVTIANNLTDAQQELVVPHALGHVVDDRAGGIPLTGIRGQAEKTYNTLATGQERERHLTTPKTQGYSRDEVLPELSAEMIRAYATDPNYLKTAAPDVAKRIRDYVNPHPEISKVLQFNAVPAAIGAGAMSMPDEGAAEPIEREAHGGGSRVVSKALEAIGRAKHVADPVERDINLGKFLQGTKTVNDEGDLQKLYHITKGDFSEFKPGGLDPQRSGPGIWLSPNPGHLPATHNVGYPGEYVEGANVMPVWASMKSPLIVENGASVEKYGSGFPAAISPEARKHLIDEGYDSVINRAMPPGQEEYIALHPQQVKSATGNSGHFDPNDPDITRAEGGEVSEGHDMDSHIARALHLARGGYATQGGVDGQAEEEYSDGIRPLTIYRNPSRSADVGAMDVSGGQGPSYDQMGNVSAPGYDPIVDAAMNVISPRREQQSPEDLAARIRDYERQRAEIEAMPEYYRQMTHGPEAPRAPVEIEGGFLGKRQLGTAPYDLAKTYSGLAQAAYDMKTLPLYFTPAAPYAMASDVAEGMAAGSPSQVAMSALGPLSRAGRMAAGLATGATAALSPDEAKADRLSKAGKAALGISNASKAKDMPLEQAMEIARRAVSAPARGKQAVPDEISGLFDYSRLSEIPKVSQFDLPRYVPARGTPERVTDLASNPDVRDKMLEVVSRGQDMGGANWYNTDPLRDKFVQQLGEDAGDKAHRKYMDFVAATSPRSKVGENVRNASYYYGREMRGEGMPAVGERNPQPYGHMAQRLHQMNAERVAGPGWDPLKNPKPASFVENLVGNQRPATVDTHAFRLPSILAQDPRFLETAYQASKDAPKMNIQKMVNSGEMTMEDALKTPA